MYGGLASRRRFAPVRDLVFQMHYTANGKETTDKTKIGLVFSKEPPTERVLTVAAVNTNFAIPPGDPDYKVESRAPHVNPGTLISFFPHMHVRGKSFEYRLVQPNGESRSPVARAEVRFQLAAFV